MSSFEVYVLMRPEIEGGFRPDSFNHLLQTEIELAGLDPRWTHTLIGAAVADDGNAAQLHVHCQAIAPRSLDRNFRVVNGTPPARVRAVTREGDVLHEATLPAPLTPGQRVAIGEDEFHVTDTLWPGRHPETGVCHGDIDWQHAVLVPADPTPKMPTSLAATPAPTEPPRDGRQIPPVTQQAAGPPHASS